MRAASATPFHNNPTLQALALASAISLALILPILIAPSWYAGMQAYRYPYLLELFTEEFSAGHIYPRWLPQLAGGHGWPTFIFYPPGFWFLALPFSMLGLSAVASCKLLLMILLPAGAMGIYRLARHFTQHMPACGAMATFLVAPFVIATLYRRGDLAELLAILLCPWTLHLLMRLAHCMVQGGSFLRPAVMLSCLLAACIYAHPITALWLTVVMGFMTYGLCRPLSLPSRIFLLKILALCMLLALCLSAPYWQPVLSLRHAADFGDGLGPRSRTSVPLTSLFSPREPYLSLAGSLLALWGLLRARRHPVPRALLLCALFLIAYMLPLLDDLRDGMPLLHYLQWPSRGINALLSVMAVGTALLLQQLTALPQQRRNQLLALIALVLTAQASPHIGIRTPLDYPAFRDSARNSMEDMTHFHEFRPRKAKPETLTPLTAPAQLHWQVQQPKAGIFTIAQFDFPGWQVALDKTPIAHSVSENGLIQLEIPAGTHQLEAWYAGPPGAALRNALAVLGIIAGLAGLRRLQLRVTG